MVGHAPDYRVIQPLEMTTMFQLWVLKEIPGVLHYSCRHSCFLHGKHNFIRSMAHNPFLYKDIPGRLADNAKSNYADVYTWDVITASEQTIKNAIEETFQRRVSSSNLIENSRIQMIKDLCS